MRFPHFFAVFSFAVTLQQLRNRSNPTPVAHPSSPAAHTRSRNHSRNSVRGGAAKRVQADEELHQVGVDWGTGGLNHVRVGAAHALIELHVRLAVGELGYFEVAEWHLEPLGHLVSKSRVVSSGEHL